MKYLLPCLQGKKLLFNHKISDFIIEKTFFDVLKNICADFLFKYTEISILSMKVDFGQSRTTLVGTLKKVITLTGTKWLFVLHT